MSEVMERHVLENLNRIEDKLDCSSFAIIETIGECFCENEVLCREIEKLKKKNRKLKKQNKEYKTFLWEHGYEV